MSTNHTFVDDVFISYSHFDNELLDEDGKGWVDNFHERFEIILGEVLGYEPRVWRDPRLPGNAYFADVLGERIKKTAVMIVILSPRYLQSNWCMGELREFFRLAEQTGGLVVGGDRMRVFKVVKTYVERNNHPPELQQQLGYEFYEIDQATLRPVAFGQELGRNRDQRYWSKLDDLAWDVKQVLSLISPRAQTVPPVLAQAEETTHLAQRTQTPPTAPVASKAEETSNSAQRTHDVFICYSSKDQKLASDVRVALEGEGVRCWIASDDVLPGENYGRAIINAINLSRLVILIFTAGANDSPHVANEIDRAFNKKKPVILFRLEDIALSHDLEYYLSTGSWLNALEPPVDKHLPILTEKVKRLLAKLKSAV